MAEQRPFKPLVVGSTPTAPTNCLLESGTYRKLGSNSSTRLQLTLLTACLNALRVGFNCTSLRVSYNVTVDSKRYAGV